MVERDTRFSTIYEFTSLAVGDIVEEYIRTGELAILVQKARDITRALEAVEFPMGHVCILISDKVAKTSPDASKKLISDALSLGVSPEENYYGDRVEAMSCLFQLILPAPEKH